MLPPFIIEQIRQREEQERLRRDADRPRLQLPVDAYWPVPDERGDDDEDSVDRGVVILDV